MRRTKEIVVPLLAVGLAVGALELALRAVDWRRDPGTLEQAFADAALPDPGAEASLGEMVRPSPDPRIIYELKPGLDVIYRSVPVRTNSAGWREGELALAKEAGTVRIVGLGDSFMFGWAVEEHERYIDRLEALLNERFPERRWETVALAAPGYNLAMEVAVLDRYGRGYGPDLVVYGFVGNDKCLPNFIAPVREDGGHSSHLLALVHRAIWSEPPDERNLEGPFQVRHGNLMLHDICHPERAPYEYRRMVGRKAVARQLIELDRIGQEVEADVVVAIPLGHKMRAGARRGLARVLERTSRTTVYEFRSRVDAYLERGGHEDVAHSPLQISPGDGHPTVLGHQMMAELILERMIADGTVARLMGRVPGG